MQVNKGMGDIARLEAIQKTSSVVQGAYVPENAGDASNTSNTSRRNDQVQISDAGLALSSDATTEGANPSNIDPARVEAIRAKVLSGAYNALSVVDQVASAILRSGDL